MVRLTNPDQTAIDPTFATGFFDHQRNGGFQYTHTLSQHFISESSLGVERSTPFFPTINSTQPGLMFADGSVRVLQLPGRNANRRIYIIDSNKAILFSRSRFSFNEVRV